MVDHLRSAATAGSSRLRFVALCLSALLLVSLIPTRVAAYAIDWDPDTGPMEAKAGDAIYGARHPGLTGTSHPQIAEIWTKFHAFAETNYVGVGDEVEKARQRQKDILWELAKAQRNPGPLLHFVQDYYSHFEYDNVRGHAKVGHKPDFISTDPDFKARRMTRDTVAVLQRFMREVLGGSPREPDYNRLWEIIDRLAKADPAPLVINPLNFNPFSGVGAPSLPKSMKMIRQAIEEDEAAGRLTARMSKLASQIFSKNSRAILARSTTHQDAEMYWHGRSRNRAMRNARGMSREDRLLWRY